MPKNKSGKPLASEFYRVSPPRKSFFFNRILRIGGLMALESGRLSQRKAVHPGS